MNISKDLCIVFDLDDTLFKEVEYLKSAYQFIANTLEESLGHNTYEEMIKWYNEGGVALDLLFEKYTIQNYTVKDLVYLYRFHFPKLIVVPSTFQLLTELKKAGHKVGLITDGRGITQRNKLKALGIENIFDEKVISEEFGSEKPTAANFLNFIVKFPNHKYFYIGDNTSKDFITPNRLGWTTIGLLDNGLNIHKQDFSIDKNYLPTHLINDISELNKYFYSK